MSEPVRAPLSESPIGAAQELILALADDEICVAHHYATWIGLGPFLEEDLAMTSIGQDELGHARALYGLLDPAGAATPGFGSSPLDRLAYGRRPDEYRCAWLVEAPTLLWEDLFVRHLLYDEAETIRWEAFRSSQLTDLASLADRALAEEAFHTRHARTLFERLLAGEIGRAHV